MLDNEDPTDTVIIPGAYYRQLLQNRRKLIALEDAGVDNWEWYDEAMQEFYNEGS